jgi:hypothetical protein
MALVAAFALVLAACPDDPVDPVDPDDPEPPPAEAFDTYNTGIFEDTRTNNYWAYLEPDTTVWTGYVLGNTKCSLYNITLPAVQITPDVAAEDVPLAEEVGGQWQVEVQLGARLPLRHGEVDERGLLETGGDLGPPGGIQPVDERGEVVGHHDVHHQLAVGHDRVAIRADHLELTNPRECGREGLGVLESLPDVLPPGLELVPSPDFHVPPNASRCDTAY